MVDNMKKRKLEEYQIEIPKPLITEVDKIVLETGLYSDPEEFVADACRRLVMEKKKMEVNSISHGKNRHFKGDIMIEKMKKKRSFKGPDPP